MAVPPRPAPPVINLEDEEESASAIADGLRRMLEAERQAHGAKREACKRLTNECEEAKRECAEAKRECEEAKRECAEAKRECAEAKRECAEWKEKGREMEVKLSHESMRNQQQMSQLNQRLGDSMWAKNKKCAEVSNLQRKNKSMEEQMDLMVDREQLGNLLWEKVNRMVSDVKECQDGMGLSFSENDKRWYSWRIQNGEKMGEAKWEDEKFVCRRTDGVSECTLPGGPGFKAALEHYKSKYDKWKVRSTWEERQVVEIEYNMLEQQLKLYAKIKKMAAMAKKQQYEEEWKKAKESDETEKEVDKCMEMLINRTIRCTPRELKYPPGEWDTERGRAVHHEGCFVDCERFQAGVDYVGVNIDHSVTVAEGKRRKNHQVFFPSVEKAQAYYRSLPKLVEFANDARDAARWEREESRKTAARVASRPSDIGAWTYKQGGTGGAGKQVADKWSLSDVARVTVHIQQQGIGKWDAMAVTLFAGRRTGKEVCRLYHNNIKQHIQGQMKRSSTDERAARAPKKRKTNAAAPRESQFAGVHWDRRNQKWIARCGKRQVENDNEIQAALIYDRMTNATQKNFLTELEAEQGHVRVTNGRGTFEIYASVSGHTLAPAQLPKEVLSHHAWHFTDEVPLDIRIRFHVPGTRVKQGRRVRIDGVLIDTPEGQRFARFHGFLDTASTITLDEAQSILSCSMQETGSTPRL